MQGVWFRDSTRRQALELDVDGYARNLEDGTVEVLACGSADKIDALEHWLRSGPPLARIDSVSERPLNDNNCPTNFAVL